MNEVLTEASVVIQTVAAIVLAFSTVRLWKATNHLAQESRRTREEAKTPRVLAKLKPLPEHGDFMQLVLSNVGRGTARNISFRLEGDEADFERHNVKLRGTLKPINFMLPAESEAYEMGGMPDLVHNAPLNPFTVVIKYQDVDDLLYEEQVVLDLYQFGELAWAGASVLWRGMDALEKIERNLKDCVQQQRGSS